MLESGCFAPSLSLFILRRRSISFRLARSHSEEPGTAMQIKPTGYPPTGADWAAKQFNGGKENYVIIMASVIHIIHNLGPDLSAGNTKEADLGDQRRPCLSEKVNPPP